MTTSSSSSVQSRPQSPGDCDGESTSSAPLKNSDLIELVRAIKYAYPDYGVKRVHREIVEVAAVKHNEPSLKEVKLSQVKQILKKMDVSASPLLDGEEKKKERDSLKMYTVGDGGVAVKAMVDEYGRKADEIAAEAARKYKESEEATAAKENDGDWKHFFLDIPADRSGQKKYQAVLNFSADNNSNAKNKMKAGANAKSKGGNNEQCDNEICKIQIAAPPPGMDPTKIPMLLYNSDRSARTFIHPVNESEDDNGYSQIRTLIVDGGKDGALGGTGGKKGYFNCRILRKSKGIVSVDVSKMCPPQTW